MIRSILFLAACTLLVGVCTGRIQCPLPTTLPPTLEEEAIAIVTELEDDLADDRDKREALWYEGGFVKSMAAASDYEQKRLLRNAYEELAMLTCTDDDIEKERSRMRERCKNKFPEKTSWWGPDKRAVCIERIDSGIRVQLRRVGKGLLDAIRLIMKKKRPALAKNKQGL